MGGKQTYLKLYLKIPNIHTLQNPLLALTREWTPAVFFPIASGMDLHSLGSCLIFYTICNFMSCSLHMSSPWPILISPSHSMANSGFLGLTPNLKRASYDFKFSLHSTLDKSSICEPGSLIYISHICKQLMLKLLQGFQVALKDS